MRFLLRSPLAALAGAVLLLAPAVPASAGGGQKGHGGAARSVRRSVNVDAAMAARRDQKRQESSVTRREAEDAEDAQDAEELDGSDGADGEASEDGTASAPDEAPGEAAEDGSEGADGSDDEQEDEPGDRHRTLGRACIFGSDGSVLYQPRGVACSRGARRARARAESRERPGAPCIVGSDGRVIYAPPGRVCRGR